MTKPERQFFDDEGKPIKYTTLESNNQHHYTTLISTTQHLTSDEVEAMLTKKKPVIDYIVEKTRKIPRKWHQKDRDLTISAARWRGTTRVVVHHPNIQVKLDDLFFTKVGKDETITMVGYYTTEKGVYLY